MRIRSATATATLAAAAALVLAACGSMDGFSTDGYSSGGASAAPAMTQGGMLVGPNKMTLYTFDKDAGGKSVCNGACAANWPPLMAGSGAAASGDWSVVTRDDGTKQWAFKGKPLYYWVKDQKPGDTTGDGVNGVWRTARP